MVYYFSITVIKFNSIPAGQKRYGNAASGKTIKRASSLAGSTPPKHLDGTLPGDFGYDPLGLGANAERLKWFAEAERIHARWAMVAVAGILVQASIVACTL